MKENCKMGLGKEEGPVGLSVGKFLFGAEVCKVIVISPNFKGVLVSFKIMTEMFEGTDNGKKFFVMNVVIEFSRLHAFGVKGDQVPVIEEVGLFEDGTKSIVQGISDRTIRA